MDFSWDFKLPFQRNQVERKEWQVISINLQQLSQYPFAQLEERNGNWGFMESYSLSFCSNHMTRQN